MLSLYDPPLFKKFSMYDLNKLNLGKLWCSVIAGNIWNGNKAMELGFWLFDFISDNLIPIPSTTSFQHDSCRHVSTYTGWRKEMSGGRHSKMSLPLYSLIDHMILMMKLICLMPWSTSLIHPPWLWTCCTIQPNSKFSGVINLNLESEIRCKMFKL